MNKTFFASYSTYSSKAIVWTSSFKNGLKQEYTMTHEAFKAWVAHVRFNGHTVIFA